MQKIRYGVIALWMLTCQVNHAAAQVSIGIGLPNLSIGINLPLFPELAPVPGYPVYYAPQVAANYFFYDGMYWVYQDDNWYASTWYNGPWAFVEPEVVPLFVLRIPVRYYRQPPIYFREWRSNEPPRWGRHWGRGWEERRSGWDRWQRSSVPARAPLPSYQRKYTGDRYPRVVEQQRELRSRGYRYQPRDKVVREHYQRQEERKGGGAPAPAQRGRQEEPQMRSPRQLDRQEEPQMRGPRQQDPQRSAPPQQGAPVFQDRRQQPQPLQREQQAPRLRDQEQRPQERGEPQEPRRGRGQE